MKGQTTLTDVEYSKRKRITKKEEFLNAMDKIIPWDKWIEEINKYYYHNKVGRKARDIETMLRMYLMQIWFNLSDEGIEDSIYDSYAMRCFSKINFLEEQVPDATTLLHFRRILESNNISKKLLEEINKILEKSGQIMKGGTIVDATIISAPSSTKNKENKRDEEMHSTKKGGNWYYGMKLHAGVDAGSGYIHTIVGTAANIHDITETKNLLREDDEVCYGDSGYLSIDKRKEVTEDNRLSKIKFITNKRPGYIKKLQKQTGIIWDKQIELMKSRTRCKVEHIFHIIKNYFGYKKVAYKGIAKNMNRLYMLCASTNLLMCIRAGRTNDFLRCATV